MQMLTSRPNKTNGVIISYTATIYYNYTTKRPWLNEKIIVIKCMIYAGEKMNYKRSKMRCSKGKKLPSSGSTEPVMLKQPFITFSLFQKAQFSAKINERIRLFNMSATPVCEDNPTTLISKCMPQCWLISLKSLRYKSVINPSRIFTYHCHGG